MNMSESDRQSNPLPKFNPYPIWSARFWWGMTFTIWFRLLRMNHFRVARSRLARLAVATLFTLVTSATGWYQSRRYHRRVSETAVREPPIFIIGHWRSGTTYLHELICLDERLAGPTIVEIFSPHNFLILESLVQRVFRFAFPRRRPMDDVVVSMEKPQEDEWALCNMGIRSPYLRV